MEQFKKNIRAAPPARGAQRWAQVPPFSQMSPTPLCRGDSRLMRQKRLSPLPPPAPAAERHCPPGANPAERAAPRGRVLRRKKGEKKSLRGERDPKRDLGGRGPRPQKTPCGRRPLSRESAPSPVLHRFGIGSLSRWLSRSRAV